MPQVALTHCVSSLSPDQTWTISFKGLYGGSVLPEAPQLEEKKEGDRTPHYEIYRSLDFIPQVWTSSAHVPSNRWDIRQTYVGNNKLGVFFPFDGENLSRDLTSFILKYSPLPHCTLYSINERVKWDNISYLEDELKRLTKQNRA